MADDTNASPLRILHCFREPTGGLFRHVRDLVDLQTEKGHAVGIVCDATTGGPREDALMEELRPKLALGLHRIAMQRHVGLGDAAAAYKTYRIIKKLQPDILHGHGAKGGVYARLFGSVLRVLRSRVARIYSPHGGSLHFDRKTRRGGAVFLIERLLAPLTDAVMFVSNFEKRIYEEKVGRPYGLHAVIYNGLAKDEFMTVADAAGASDFLFVGTMRELKGPDVMIRALARLRDRNQRALTATLVGDGAEKPGFIALAEELGVSGQIRFLPGMAAREAFALGRVMVVPSRAEAFPYIVLEALAAGKSVIASNVGGIPEVFGPRSPALVEPEEEALAHKMLGVADDPAAFRAAMPDAERLYERFSLQTMAHSIETIYYEAHPDRAVPED
ncbi:glycosyl transferase [Ochrobactrum sp. 695/2009]|nr:glycosyltransferase family 4 protein [Brucella intermedia]PJR88774.1 glycosyl transferase [Ochrobactrum sp. 721/2009]PJT16757.1 glycosyl transferase [Ochrobactrum sp. 720/2009]PJT26578.1 glycosyl transferase [Ochrobactrum sp. 715/2009]PJT28605.1 glycosyl transferase [Ochrobactrum sp. 695/2009]PJT36099.1 glycosyl transferase [Ochrobactrum sp. 689/2009]